MGGAPPPAWASQKKCPVSSHSQLTLDSIPEREQLAPAVHGAPSPHDRGFRTIALAVPPEPPVPLRPLSALPPLPAVPADPPGSPVRLLEEDSSLPPHAPSPVAASAE